MFDIFISLYDAIKNLVPILITIVLLWGVVGIFFVHVMNKEFHDFVLLTIITAIIVASCVIIVNRDIQILLFGN